MSGLSGTSSYAVLVYLCICIFVFLHLTHRDIVFYTLEKSSFKKLQHAEVAQGSAGTPRVKILSTRGVQDYSEIARKEVKIELYGQGQLKESQTLRPFAY